jgi:D-glycerate 3-kinase
MRSNPVDAVDAYYADVADWCLGLLGNQLGAVGSSGTRGPRGAGALVIGINAPQGAGKSTLVRWLEARLALDGLRVVGVSIDDFYRTRLELEALAQAHPDNRYLGQRGYPGTHDIALGNATLDALVSASDGQIVSVPVYDKSAHGGLGDRMPGGAWRQVTGPVDVVLFEGWMLGFVPVGVSKTTDLALAEVDRLLVDYAPWRDRLGAMLQLIAADPRSVIDWRMEAEAKMRAQGRPGLSDAAIRDYIERFLPAYTVWPEGLRADPPVPERHATLVIGADRLPVSRAGWRGQ